MLQGTNLQSRNVDRNVFAKGNLKEDFVEVKVNDPGVEHGLCNKLTDDA